MIGIGTPNNQSRIGMASSLPGPRHEPAFIPRTVAMLAAFDRREARREGAEEQSGSHPERELHGIASGTIERSFGFIDHGVDALLRLRVADAGLPRDKMGDIGPVVRLQALAIGEACGPQPDNLGPGSVVVLRAGGRRRCAGWRRRRRCRSARSS